MNIYVNVLYLNGNLNKSLFPSCADVMPGLNLSVLLYSYFCIHAIGLNPESLWDNEVQYSYILFPEASYTGCWCNPTSLLVFLCSE